MTLSVLGIYHKSNRIYASVGAANLASECVHFVDAAVLSFILKRLALSRKPENVARSQRLASSCPWA